MISILVSDLSGSGSGRWGLDSGDRPFVIHKALGLAGYRSEIIGLSGDHTISQDPTRGLKIIPRQQGVGIWQSFRQVLAAIQGDIIYAYKPKVGSFGLALGARTLSRRPVFLDIDDWELSWHGGDQFRYAPSLRQLGRDVLKSGGALRNPDHPAYLKKLEGWIAKADGVTTHNQFLQDRFGGIWLPNGKDVHLFNPEQYNPEQSRHELGLSGYRILMFPGAPRPYKGVEDVLTALDILDEPDLKLVIVGGSPYDQYDAYLHQNWGDRLIQLPKTQYQAMPRHIAAAHVLVVPQRDDPATRAQFPLKITDGMAMAKPILATRVGDIPRILGDTGYLVEPDAPAALANKIREIFSNYEQALQRGQTARTRCQEKYSVECMGEILNGLFKTYSTVTA